MTLPELVVYLRDFRVEYKSLEAELHNQNGPVVTRFFSRVTDTGKVVVCPAPAVSQEDNLSWIIIQQIAKALDIPYREAFATVDGFQHGE
jgi:hypothetical protein